MTALDPSSPPVAALPPARPVVRDRHLLVVALVVALAPVVAVLLTRVGRPYVPVSDPANIDLLVRDVFSSNTPLVGAYSRGFSHPGPSLYWALTPLSAVTGHAAWATLVGAALLQGGAIAAVAWLTFRRAGIGLTLVMLAALALVYAGFDESGQFVKAWNPIVAVPVFLLFLVAAWALARGDRWQALTVALTGSFVVQAHVGYAPLVLAVVAWALIVLAVDRPRPDRVPRWTVVSAWSGVILLVLWIPPLIQQLRDEPGNLGELWHYFNSGEPSAGLRTGAGLLATEFKLLPPWLGGHESFAFGSGVATPSSPAWLLVPAALLAVAWWCARRTHRRGDQRLVELAALVAVVSVLTLARISVELSPYLFYWRLVVGTFVVAASGYAIAHAVGVAASARGRVVCAGALVVVMVVGFGSQVLDVVNHADYVAPTEAAVESMVDRLTRDGGPDQPVLVRAVGDHLGGVQQGVVDGLDRAGVDVRVDPRFAYRFGSHRGAAADAVGEIWYVSEEGRDLSLLPRRDDVRLVAWSSPLSPADERELRRLQRDAADALTDAGAADRIPLLDNPFLGPLADAEPLPGVSQADADRMGELNQAVARSRSCRCAVLATSPLVPELLPTTD